MSPKPGARPSRRAKPRPKGANSRLKGANPRLKGANPRASARPGRASTTRTTASSRGAARAVAKKTSARANAGARKRTRTASAQPKRAKAVAKRVVRAVATRRPVAKRPTRPGRVPASRANPAPRPRSTAANAPHTTSPPVPPAFSTQRAGASAREELLFELQRARASVKAATQGLSSGNAERPIAAGKWCIKEIVLHLGERDRVRLEEFGRALGGLPRSWAGISDEDQAAVNEVHLTPLRAHTWDEAVRRMDSLREQLLHRLAQLPAQPDDVWQRGHAFGDMMWGLPEHDRHHADQIKLARLGELVPVED